MLEVLQRRCGALRGAITLLEEGSGMLVVEAALGYPRPSGRVRYRVGEGVTGMVAQSGTPAVVPRVSREPRLLHRAAERSQRGDEITFICVPIGPWTEARPAPWPSSWATSPGATATAR